MTTCDLSVAELFGGRKEVEKFRYYGYPPTRVIDQKDFPSFAAGLAELHRFGVWVNENALQAQTPDHVTYVVVCKRRHLLDFWRRCYVSGDGYSVSKKQADRLRKQIEALNPRKLYALIAYEY